MFEKIRAAFSRKKTEEKREFTIRVNQVNKIGDSYAYTVEGSDRKEAQRRIVEYFFGVPSEAGSYDKIKSTHGTIVFPMHCYVRAVDNNIFSGSDGDRFARLISGSGEASEADYAWLDLFIAENNIQKRS